MINIRVTRSLAFVLHTMWRAGHCPPPKNDRNKILVIITIGLDFEDPTFQNLVKWALKKLFLGRQ